MFKKIFLLPAVLAVAALVSGCGVPFSTNIPITISVPASGTAESISAIPTEAQDSKIKFSSVSVTYTVSKANVVTDYDVDLDVYASPDQTVDNLKNITTDETVINASIPNGDTTITGTSSSSVILDALNNHQSSFIMGITNDSVSQSGDINIEVNVAIEGTYSLF